MMIWDVESTQWNMVQQPQFSLPQIWKTHGVAKKHDPHLVGFANHVNVNLLEDRLPYIPPNARP